eukprot:scaffold125800_cov63-Phaeocystis_antarctica.AAC.1
MPGCARPPTHRCRRRSGRSAETLAGVPRHRRSWRRRTLEEPHVKQADAPRRGKVVRYVERHCPAAEGFPVVNVVLGCGDHPRVPDHLQHRVQNGEGSATESGLLLSHWWSGSTRIATAYLHRGHSPAGAMAMDGFHECMRVGRAIGRFDHGPLITPKSIVSGANRSGSQICGCAPLMYCALVNDASRVSRNTRPLSLTASSITFRSVAEWTFCAPSAATTLASLYMRLRL